MWHCDNCNEDFYEPTIKNTTYERFYGVSEEFGYSTPMSIEVCPYCGSDEINEEEEEEMDG